MSDECVKSGTVDYNGQQLLQDGSSSESGGIEMGLGVTAVGMEWEWDR